MECNKIQGKLSLYIDAAVSSDEKAIIYEHLRTCQKCKEAYFDLKKTVVHLKRLDEIEPPSWLTQKVMAKIKEEAVPKKGILQRLFYPLHIKLPLEAFATIVIAISALYIFKTVQPEVQFAKAPEQEVAPQIPPKEADRPASSQAEKPMPDKRFTENPPLHPSQEGTYGRELLARDKVMKQSRLLEKGMSIQKDEIASSSTRNDIAAQTKLAEQPLPAPEPKTLGKLESPKSIAPSEQPELTKAERAPSPAKKT